MKDLVMPGDSPRRHCPRTDTFAAGVMSLLVLASLPSAVAAQAVEGEFERTLTVNGPADVNVVSGAGSIEVRPGAAGRIEVRARIRAGRDGDRNGRLSAEERVRRLEANPPIEQTGNRVRIGDIPDDDLRDGVSISYTVTVPTETSVRSRTGSGAHRIDGVGGSIEAASGSGSIRIANAGRDVRATTGSGSILAATVDGAFEARSGSGSIEGTAIAGAVTARTGSGRILLSQSGRGDVEASSGSGSITLRGIRGGVRASAASGSIEVEGEQMAEWRLSSASGSITVDLDGNPAFTLDAHSNSGRIVTDFPVTVAGTIGRRDLRGSVNGGGALLHVRSTSGGIVIR